MGHKPYGVTPLLFYYGKIESVFCDIFAFKML